MGQLQQRRGSLRAARHPLPRAREDGEGDRVPRQALLAVDQRHANHRRLRGHPVARRQGANRRHDGDGDVVPGAVQEAAQGYARLARVRGPAEED